jgi:CBS domain-containing protein
MALKTTLKNIVKIDLPTVEPSTSIKKVIELMARRGACALGIGMNGELIGVISDLDLAAALIHGGNPETMPVSEFMTACDLITGQGAKSPCVQLDEDETVENGLKLLEGTGIHNLMVSGPHDPARRASLRGQ